MTDLSKVLNDNAGVDDEQFKEMIAQNSLFKNIYKSDIRLASDLDDDDEDVEDDDFDEEDEDLFDEDELEEEGYEEDFDFDEEDEDEDEDESDDLGAYN
jgi:hypothetical protein